MDRSTIEFLSEKLKSNPDFSKMLSAEELEEIKNYSGENDVIEKRRAEEKSTFAIEMKRRNSYNYHKRTSFCNRCYWLENDITENSPFITSSEGARRFLEVDMDKKDFERIIDEWASNPSSNDLFNGDNHHWMSEGEFLEYTTRKIVGNLVDELSPSRRFLVCWYPPYTSTDCFGYSIRNEASLGSVDILRGVGEYGIMNESAYDNNRYFNEHYFHSASNIRTASEMESLIFSHFNFFVKGKNEKFALCDIEYDGNGGFTIKGKSDVMTFEEHFKRLFGFLPSENTQKETAD